MAAAVLLTAPASTQTYYLSVDVPAELPSSEDAVGEFTSNQIVERNDGGYRTINSIDSTGSIGAVVQRNDGGFRMAPSSTTTLGGADYKPRDVFSFDGVSYAMVLDGSVAGIPDYARIDSLFMDASEDLILGFDVPVNLAGTEYGRSDLVLYSGGVFSLYWDGVAAGVPDYANLLDADTKDGDLFMFFDVPVNLGGTEYMPGDAVRWNSSTGWSLYVSEGASWPPYAQARGFCFINAPAGGGVPGGVPDGKDVAGTPLSVGLSGADITLSWGASCSAGATGYVIYEGDLASGYGSLAPLPNLCAAPLAGTTHTFASAYATSFYVVVPQTSAEEGTYGRDNAGAERPASEAACRAPNMQICP